jgi:hypothetical protein
MPRMKWNEDTEWREMNDAEYEEYEEFEEYDGPLPPNNLILSGYIKKIWATESQAGNDMLKVVFEADGNTGERKVYNGWGGWDNVTLTPGTKFRWQPFFDVLGVTLADVKNKTVVDDEDDNNGAHVLRIGKVKLDGVKVPARIKVKREKYEGEWQAKVGKWLPPAENADPTDDDDAELDDLDDNPF